MATNYGTLVGFNAYFTARGIDIPVSWTNAFITAKLLVASEWLDARFRPMFGGSKVGMRAQEREWPRHDVVDVYGYAVAFDSVPVEIENATYEAAFKEATAPGALSQDVIPNKYKSASVDGAVSVTYNDFTSADEAQTIFVKVGEILSNLLAYNAGQSTLSGKSVRV